METFTVIRGFQRSPQNLTRGIRVLISLTAAHSTINCKYSPKKMFFFLEPLYVITILSEMNVTRNWRSFAGFAASTTTRGE